MSQDHREQTGEEVLYVTEQQAVPESDDEHQLPAEPLAEEPVEPEAGEPPAAEVEETEPGPEPEPEPESTEEGTAAEAPAVEQQEEEPAAADEAEPAKQQEQEPELEEPEHISNEDVIASFLQANASANDGPIDSSVVHQETMSSLIVEGSADGITDGNDSVDLPVANGSTATAVAAAAQDGFAKDEGKDDGVAGVSARIKRLSSLFESSPEAPPPVAKLSPAVGKLKHSFGGAPLPPDGPPASSRLSSAGAEKSQAPASMLAEVTDKDRINTANVFRLIETAEFAKKPLVDFIPYEQLVKLRIEDGIDATHKELYLTETEFLEVFGFTRAAYDAMPRWKQQQAKRSVNLF